MYFARSILLLPDENIAFFNFISTYFCYFNIFLIKVVITNIYIRYWKTPKLWNDDNLLSVRFASSFKKPPLKFDATLLYTCIFYSDSKDCDFFSNWESKYIYIIELNQNVNSVMTESYYQWYIFFWNEKSGKIR